MLDTLKKNPLRRKRESPSEPKSPNPDNHTTKRMRRISQVISKAPNRLSRFFDVGRGHAPDPELEELVNQVQELRATGQDLMERLKEADSEVERTRQMLKDRENQREELKRITKELAVAQKFLSTADSLSQAEVVRAMEDLNEEIFQLTSIVADMIQVEEKQLQPEEHQAGFQERIPAAALGPVFFDVVVPKHLEDTLAIQIGWQAILVDWCSNIIEAWVVGGKRGRELNSVLDDVYRGIMSQSGQAVGGRWRSMLFQVADEVSSETRRSLIVPVIQALTALPVLCGYIASRKQHQELGNAFEQRIGPLLEKSLRFRKMVGEGITSMDVRPYLFKSGDKYNPKYVVLEYEDEKNGTPEGKQGVVACSLGLGLYCARSVKGEDGKFREGSRDPILKPKVILQETLKEIIE